MGEETLISAKQGVKEQIVEYASEKNIILDAEALNLLENEKDFKGIIDKALSENNFMLDEENVRNIILKRQSKLSAVEEVTIKKVTQTALAKDLDADFRIMEEYDIEKNSSAEGNVGDFLDYFQDKFKFLSSLLGKRTGITPKLIPYLEKVQKNEEIHLIGMVKEKWQTKNGNLAIQIEDMEGECIALILKDNKPLTQEARTVMLDNVIAVKARKMNNDMVIVSDLCWPELPHRPEKFGERDLGLAAIADIHIGSKLFLEKEFENFIRWLNLEIGNKKDAMEAGKIKYLLIAGDNVDGIGVYPDQYDELSIKDIYGQYEVYSEFMEQIPDYIEVFVTPGQHDAVRRADPQPPISKEFVPKLYEKDNFHFLGSPNWLEIEGLKVLTYHGASLHELYGNISTLSVSKPQKAIVELLKRRDLMSVYGGRQPYIPNKKDLMLIREEPDLYIGGDMHHTGYGKYKSCLIVNAGTWQLQTEYQKSLGSIPTPGVVPVVNLHTRTIKENYFMESGN